MSEDPNNEPETMTRGSDVIRRGDVLNISEYSDVLQNKLKECEKTACESEKNMNKMFVWDLL